MRRTAMYRPGSMSLLDQPDFLIEHTRIHGRSVSDPPIPGPIFRCLRSFFSPKEREEATTAGEDPYERLSLERQLRATWTHTG